MLKPTYETVTIARNEATNISHTLASLVDQTLKPSRIIVVDDGSVDDTPEVAARFGCVVVRLPYHSQSYLGRPELASVINAGLGRVSEKTDYVVMVDADNPLPVGYVADLMGRMEEDDLVVAASGMLVGEPVDFEMPRNSGFVVKTEAWRRLNGMRYPLIYGYESWLRFKFIQAGLKAKVYPEIKSQVRRKTRLKGVYDGRAMYVLGYGLAYASGRVAINMPRQPLNSIEALAGYLSHGDLERSDIAEWVRDRQRAQLIYKIRQRFARVLKVGRKDRVPRGRSRT
jgi:glycosyltransferase involved in cell wall biosynthesis